MDNGDDAPLVSAVHFTAEKGGVGMLTNNGLIQIYSRFTSQIKEYKTLTGVTSKVNAYGLDTVVKYMNEIGESTKHALLLGSDDSPVSRDNYAWDHDITSLFSITSSSFVLLADNTICISTACVNTTDADIEVKEIGWVASINTNVDKALLAREVFNEPVIVKANGGVQTFGLRIG